MEKVASPVHKVVAKDYLGLQDKVSHLQSSTASLAAKFEAAVDVIKTACVNEFNDTESLSEVFSMLKIAGVSEPLAEYVFQQIKDDVTVRTYEEALRMALLSGEPNTDHELYKAASVLASTSEELVAEYDELAENEKLLADAKGSLGLF
jgi:hypothetical protein